MSLVMIPAQVFESEEYKTMTGVTREFLLRLYYLFGDCETFMVDRNVPAECGEADPTTITNKLAKLLKAGLIQVHQAEDNNRFNPRPRVLKFKYSAVAAYQ